MDERWLKAPSGTVSGALSGRIANGPDGQEMLDRPPGMVPLMGDRGDDAACP